MVKVVPLSFSLWNVTSPFWASMKRFTTARPKPCPLAFVVKRGWKILCLFVSGMPVPVSFMWMVAFWFSCVASMVILPVSGMACAALVMRFIRALLVMAGSIMIFGMPS